LKWAGGKRWLIDHLREIWASHFHRRLVEPLGGGLAITLGLMPQEAWVNDINPHLVNFYKWVARGMTLEFTDADHDRAAYYRHRSRFNELVRSGESQSREAARLFYYLNRTGYNGLCRFNGSGEFNVPFGKYRRVSYVKDFRAYQEVFRRWEFTYLDFEQMQLDPEDFVYADPPYDVQFTKYSKNGFTWDDQVRLARWLSGHPGPVVVSNQSTPRIRKLYRDFGFKLTEVAGPRRISCNGDRTPAVEVLGLKGA